ncbi:MAG TPA: UxaA family hydrolase [Anaerolineales bacterium]|nr:UxaA family hydrolase [Anaerolineales bacterium]
MKKGILLHESADDVGVAVMDLKTGEEIAVVTLEGQPVKEIKLVNDVPLGHKVAMRDLAPEMVVIEYGRTIGAVSAAIAAGEHVHVHNIKSLRWAASNTNLLEK